MLASDAASAAATWRLQLYGDKRANMIVDPIIEPLWTGPRILAFADRGDIRLTADDGQSIEGHDEVEAALAVASAGATLLLEAFLTPEPIQASGDMAVLDGVPVPKPGQALAQMIVGSRGDRKERLASRQEEARRRTIEGIEVAADRLALVAVDLLWLDDESLCDVPLLERKRILESVLPESHLVRVSVHVKPPIDSWLGSWRSFGFRRLSFKAANSRYLPGQKNADWALAEIPQR